MQHIRHKKLIVHQQKQIIFRWQVSKMKKLLTKVMALQVKISIEQILSLIGKLGNLLKTELSQRQWVQPIRSLLRFEVRRLLEQVIVREQFVKPPKTALMLQQEIQSKIKQVSWMRQEKRALIIQNQALLMIPSQKWHSVIERFMGQIKVLWDQLATIQTFRKLQLSEQGILAVYYYFQVNHNVAILRDPTRYLLEPVHC